MAVDQATKARYTQYEATVLDFVNKDNGRFIVLSDDQSFVTQLRLTLVKELGISQPAVFVPLTDPGHLLRAIKEAHLHTQSPIVFLERIMGGRDLSFMVQQFKEAYPELRIIILTVDIERARLMLLHEVGADNFIAKPVSANTLIEKIAFTIKPQNKLGQLIDTARQMIAQGMPEKALALCEQILQTKPDSAAGLLLQGDAYRAMKQLKNAGLAYEKAAETTEFFLEPLRRLADLYGEMGKTDMRLLYLQRLDQLSPLNVDRKVDMGEIHLQMGNDDQAEALFDKAMVQITKDALSNISSVSGRIAGIYSEKDPVKAEKFLRKSLEAKGRYLSREDLSTFNQLGISLRQQGRWKDALSEYKKALKIAADDENLFYNMAMANAEGKDFDEACICMRKALEINPEMPAENPNIAYNMAIVFYQAKAQERAIKCLHIALESDPDFVPAKQLLARIHKKKISA